MRKLVRGDRFSLVRPGASSNNTTNHSHNPSHAPRSRELRGSGSSSPLECLLGPPGSARAPPSVVTDVSDLDGSITSDLVRSSISESIHASNAHTTAQHHHPGCGHTYPRYARASLNHYTTGLDAEETILCNDPNCCCCTASASGVPDPTLPPLLRLPAELRLKIFSYLLPSTTGVFKIYTDCSTILSGSREPSRFNASTSRASIRMPASTSPYSSLSPRTFARAWHHPLPYFVSASYHPNYSTNPTPPLPLLAASLGRQGDKLAVLRVNRQVYYDCLSVLYSENLFHFIGSTYPPILDFFRRLGPDALAHVRSVRVTMLPVGGAARGMMMTTVGSGYGTGRGGGAGAGRRGDCGSGSGSGGAGAGGSGIVGGRIGALDRRFDVFCGVMQDLMPGLNVLDVSEPRFETCAAKEKTPAGEENGVVMSRI